MCVLWNILTVLYKINIVVSFKWLVCRITERRIEVCFQPCNYASHTKTMLPMRKSVPRSSRQSDDMKTSWHHKETQTAVVWSHLPFFTSGQNHLARHSERGKKTRQTEEEVGRQHQGMDRPGVRQVPEGSGEQGRMEKTGCEIICGAPTTLTVKG